MIINFNHYSLIDKIIIITIIILLTLFIITIIYLCIYQLYIHVKTKKRKKNIETIYNLNIDIDKEKIKTEICCICLESFIKKSKIIKTDCRFFFIIINVYIFGIINQTCFNCPICRKSNPNIIIIII